MVTFFDLKQHFYVLAEKLHEGRAKVTGIHDYGDKIIIVVCPIDAQAPRQVTVVDTTRAPMEDQIREVEAVEDADAVLEAPTITIDPDVAPCKYCGKLFSKRGLTRHENKCDGNTEEGEEEEE